MGEIIRPLYCCYTLAFSCLYLGLHIALLLLRSPQKAWHPHPPPILGQHDVAAGGCPVNAFLDWHKHCSPNFRTAARGGGGSWRNRNGGVKTAAWRTFMRRRRRPTLHHAVKDKRVTVLGPVKQPEMDFMSHRGGTDGMSHRGAPPLPFKWNSAGVLRIASVLNIDSMFRCRGLLKGCDSRGPPVFVAVSEQVLHRCDPLFRRPFFVPQGAPPPHRPARSRAPRPPPAAQWPPQPPLPPPRSP